MNIQRHDEMIAVAKRNLLNAITDATDALATYRQVLKNVEGEVNAAGWEAARNAASDAAPLNPAALTELIESTKKIAGKLAGADAIRDLLNATYAHS